MRLTRPTPTSLLLGLTGAAIILGAATSSPTHHPGPVGADGVPPGDVHAFVVSSSIPPDVTDGTGTFQDLHDPKKIPASQRVFDRFAWEAFVGLNWAAKDNGMPDPAIATPADDAKEHFQRPRVWETFAETNTLFKAKGAAPEPWLKDRPPQWSAGHPMQPADEVVWMTTKVHNRNTRSHSSLADENIQAFTGPLVDQNGKWVRYQVRVNRTEYTYIRDNGLYSLEGQERHLASGKDIDFPKNGDVLNGETMTYGSIEIKVAWKQLAELRNAADITSHTTDDAFLASLGLTCVTVSDGEGKPPRFDHYAVADSAKYTKQFTWFDAPGRFLWRYVRVIHQGGPVDAGGIPVPDPLPVPLGVVGMHISMRTKSSPQWIWATFEHVDNVAVNDLQMATMPDGTTKPLRPLFANPDRPADPVNIQPPTNAHPDPVTGKFTDWTEAETTKPVQVLRVLPIPKATAEMNAIAQEKLRVAQSVLQYYELVGVQWPVQPDVPNFPSGQGSAPESVVLKVPGVVVPTFVANTTMETYFQGGNQPAGGQERDNRPPKSSDDPTLIFATESCVGCHFSAGACRGFKLDTSKVVRNPATGAYDYPFELKDGRKVPIFGIDGHGGKTGNANFSWLLQMKAQSTGAGVDNDTFLKEVRKTQAAGTAANAPASINAAGADPQQVPPTTK